MQNRIDKIRDMHRYISEEIEKANKVLDNVICDEHYEVFKRHLEALKSAQLETYNLLVFEEEYFKNIGLIK